MVFVDIETGGLETSRPIIQIGAIAVDRELCEAERFEIKIQFDESKACPHALRRIHYRRAEWRRTAIPARRAALLFSRFLRRHATVEVHGRRLSAFRVAQLAAHNAEFDGAFLRTWYGRLGLFLPASYRVLCTLQRTYWYFHENPQLCPPDDYRLLTLCNYFGIPLRTDQAHEALNDAQASVDLYRVLDSKDTGTKHPSASNRSDT